jgi:hypothetical protein
MFLKKKQIVVIFGIVCILLHLTQANLLPSTASNYTYLNLNVLL